jgi:hypothetical protein
VRRPELSGRELAFVLIAAYAAAWFVTMRLYWDIYAGPIRGTDFSSYYTAGRLVLGGRGADLYAVAPGDAVLGDATSGPWREAADAAGVPRQHYYIYPPLFAALAAPLAALPFRTALDVWLGLDLALLALFGWLYRRTRGRDLSFPEAAFLIAACLFEFLPLIWAMAIGQTSLLVLVLLTGALLAFRRGADAAAGVLVGVAATVKLTPALLAVYFAWRRRHRAALAAGATFAALQAAGVALLGWEVHRIFYLELLPAMAGGTCYFLNQSLGALFNRLLTDGDVRQVALVDSTAARLLASAASVGLIALCAPRLRRARPDVPLGDELQFGVVILLTLAVSPISWTHHYLTALLPLAAVVGNLARRREPPLLPAAVAGAALLLIARKPHPDLFLTGPARIFNSAALFGALLLLGLGLHALGPSRRAEGRT